MHCFVKPNDAIFFNAACGGQDLCAAVFAPRVVFDVFVGSGHNQGRAAHERVIIRGTLLPQRAQNFHVVGVREARMNGVVLLNFKIL